jgi:hypothetical protein
MSTSDDRVHMTPLVFTPPPAFFSTIVDDLYVVDHHARTVLIAARLAQAFDPAAMSWQDHRLSYTAAPPPPLPTAKTSAIRLHLSNRHMRPVAIAAAATSSLVRIKELVRL